MLIHVTQSHIDRGCRCDGENCPVKHAITDATGIKHVIVAEDFITFNPGIDGFSVRTPRAVAVWIRRYDQSELVEPFEFELDVEGVGMSARQRALLERKSQRRWIKVGVFPFSEDKPHRFNAYTTWYNPQWKGCCEHDVFAANGTEAKKMAIQEHRESCVEGVG